MDHLLTPPCHCAFHVIANEVWQPACRQAGLTPPSLSFPRRRESIQILSKGFTLVEVLLVVSILVVIGLGLITALNPMTQIFRGFDTVRKTDLAKLKVAFESYYEDHGCYPDDTVLSECGGSGLNPYMDKIPCDPSTKEPYESFLTPSIATCKQNFVIYTTLANIFDPDGKKIPYCDNVYATNSSGVSQGTVIAGCSGMTLCPLLFGCVNGTCSLVAEDSFPVCYPNYCQDPTCNNRCSNPSYECVSN